MPEGPVQNGQARRALQTQTINFVVDLVTLLVMLGITGTGLLIKYVLPSCPQGGRGLRLWGYTRHDWGDVHFWLAAALTGLIILHVVLHWTWVCATASRLLPSGTASPGRLSARRRMVYGAAFLLATSALLFGFLWIARVSVQAPGANGERGGHQYRGGRGEAALQQQDFGTYRTADRMQADSTIRP